MNKGLIKIKKYHENNIKDYNDNPNKCLYCDDCILHEKGTLSFTKIKKFCSRSCAASYNNTRRIRIKKEKIKKELLRESISNKTKGELLLINKSYFSMRSGICKDARAKLKKSKREQICINCGYDKHVQTCHIKNISSFANDIKISEINSIDNLIYLCPNCHWEFDHNILKLK